MSKPFVDGEYVTPVQAFNQIDYYRYNWGSEAHPSQTFPVGSKFQVRRVDGNTILLYGVSGWLTASKFKRLEDINKAEDHVEPTERTPPMTTNAPVMISREQLEQFREHLDADAPMTIRNILDKYLGKGVSFDDIEEGDHFITEKHLGCFIKSGKYAVHIEPSPHGYGEAVMTVHVASEIDFGFINAVDMDNTEVSIQIPSSNFCDGDTFRFEM